MSFHENNVTLLGYYGGDKRICLSAWQSTELALDQQLIDLDIARRIEVLYEDTVVNKKRPPADLLKFLAEHRHETPFEKSTLDFQIRGDIASMIHCIKHRIAVSINCESARYKELKDKWLIPKDWENVFIDNEHFLGNSAGSFFLQNYRPGNWATALEIYSQFGHDLYHLSVKDLTEKLGRKRAKESARYFLPYNKQLDFDCMFNFRSFMHFLKLRSSDAAQKEIREIALEMLRQVAEIPGGPFKDSLTAFGYTPEKIQELLAS